MGVWLDVEQEWERGSELIGERYCMTAPKSLSTQQSHPAPTLPHI